MVNLRIDWKKWKETEDDFNKMVESGRLGDLLEEIGFSGESSSNSFFFNPRALTKEDLKYIEKDLGINIESLKKQKEKASAYLDFQQKDE